jgi:hypothetical protein
MLEVLPSPLYLLVLEDDLATDQVEYFSSATGYLETNGCGTVWD